MKIPVRNIYYILSYAWRYYKPGVIKKIDQKDFRNETEFFAEIFDLVLSKYIKQGLYKDYVLRQGIQKTIKGKIDFGASMKSAANNSKSLNCIYDEYSSDNRINQLIYSTIHLILDANIDENQRKSIKRKLIYFSDFSNTKVDRTQVNSIRPIRGNHTLNFLVNISRYIQSNSGFDQREGKYEFGDFAEKGMGTVFEKFAYNFYRIHFPKLQVRNGELIKWDSDTEDSLYPIMKTDITVRKENAIVVIDTKFYQNMFNHHYLNPEKSKFISSNIYQLYTYVNNFRCKDRAIEGMLLYPNTSETVRNQRIISGKRMSINNINLNQEWEQIESEMIDLMN